MPNKRAAVILAAGKSTRMKSAKSKVLHEIGGRSMLQWVAEAARNSGAEKVVCVVGGGNDDVRAQAETLGLEIAVQEPQLGTGHAVSCAKKALEDFSGDIIVLYADTPLISTNTLNRVFAGLDAGSDIVVLGFEPDDPGAYGRLVVQGEQLEAIVEAKDASAEELAITLCNSGVMAASHDNMFSALAEVGNDNAKNEYYLTDIVQVMTSKKRTAQVVKVNADEVMGVNSRPDLALVERAFQNKMRRDAMQNGVTLRDPESVYFSHDTVIECDAEIGAQVVFGPGVSVEKDAVIHAFCHIEGARIGRGAQIGPFARLRPGTDMGVGSKAGNFVEVKKSSVGKGSKINHLTYIGDSIIGDGANIGAGTITCNYDGYFKHQTRIGDGAFVGSNSSLIAPITIGDGAYIGSGTVVSKDVEADALALARADLNQKSGWAKRYRAAQQKRKTTQKKTK